MYTGQTSLIFAEENQLSYPEVFPANPYLLQVKEKGNKMIDGCGMSSTELSLSADHLGLLQKMSLDWLRFQNIPGLSMTWKRKVTQSRLSYYLLQMSVRRTSGKEHSLLPTPAATDWKRSLVARADMSRKSPGVPVYAAMVDAGIFNLPTPCTSQIYKIIRPLSPSEVGGGAWSHADCYGREDISLPDWKKNPSEICRVDDGFSRRLDKSRLQALGNAVVPRVVYPFFRAIQQIERGETTCQK